MKIKRSEVKRAIQESIATDIDVDAMKVINSVVDPYIQDQTEILQQVKSQRVRPEDAKVILRLILLKSEDFVKALRIAIHTR